jgi:hypothetical protein
VLCWQEYSKYDLLSFSDFEVLTAVSVKNGVFRKMIQCTLVDGYEFLEELAASIFIAEEYSPAASETLVTIYRKPQHHIRGDHHFGTHYICEKLLNINL